MDAFLNRVQTSSWLIRKDAKFSRAKIKKKPQKLDSIGRKHELFFPTPPTSPSVSKFSVDVKIRGGATLNHKKMNKPNDDDWKRRRKNRKPFSPSGSWLKFLTPPVVFEVDSITIKTGKGEKQTGWSRATWNSKCEGTPPIGAWLLNISTCK